MKLRLFLDYFRKHLACSQKENKECAKVSKFEWVQVDYTFVRNNIIIVRVM